MNRVRGRISAMVQWSFAVSALLFGVIAGLLVAVHVPAGLALIAAMVLGAYLSILFWQYRCARFASKTIVPPPSPR
jgi:hypothetical protein